MAGVAVSRAGSLVRVSLETGGDVGVEKTPTGRDHGAGVLAASWKPGDRAAKRTRCTICGTGVVAAKLVVGCSVREIPAAVASAMSVAHCVERREQGEENMI